MNGTDIKLVSYYRARPEESIEERHAEITRNMREFGPPLGWAGLPVPPAPDCGADLSADYSVKYPIPGLQHMAFYSYRSERYLGPDEASYDDTFILSFKTDNRYLDYRAILHEHFPKAIHAFRAYQAAVRVGLYAINYLDENKDSYQRLRADKSTDVNGRNNIFTLHVATYWDDLLCRRALGYGPKEAIRRLRGKVPLVMPLMDGVYTVFSDDPDLSFAEFAAINDKFKSILDLA